METYKKMSGKFGILIGASGGMGRATALLLASQGATLVLADMAEQAIQVLAEEISATGAPAPLAVAMNVTSEADVARMVSTTLEAFGRIDFLVNCHGIVQNVPFLDLEPSDWDRMMEVNLRGTYLICRRVAQAMVKQGSGVIVNVASVAGRSKSIENGAHYTVSKHGVIGLSRHMASELGPLGVRVNAFCPGATVTSIVAAPEKRAEISSKWPLRRYGLPEEQASVISFLVSDESSFITGACIDSNGGALMV